MRKKPDSPETDLVYDKQEDAIFECVVYNNDFVDQTPVDMWYEHGHGRRLPWMAHRSTSLGIVETYAVATTSDELCVNARNDGDR